MKKIIGSFLIVYAALQNTPFFISNIVVYASVFIGSFLLLMLSGNFKISKSYYTYFSYAWLFYGVFSIFWVENIYMWFRSNVILLILLLSILIFMNLIKKQEDILFYSKVWTYVVGFASLIGWLEIYTKKYYFTTSPYIYKYIVYKWPLFSFYNVNDYATYLVISIPIILIYLNFTDLKVQKTLGYIIITATILLLIFTESRGSWLALLIGVLITFVKTTNKITKKSLLLIYVILFLMLFGMIIAWESGVLNAFMSEYIYGKKSSDNLRLDLIKNGLKYLENSYYLGVGSGNIEWWFSKVQYYQTPGWTHLHNWWIEVLVNYGVFIFGGYLLFWFKLFRINFVKYNQGNKLAKYILMSIVIFSISIFSPSSILLMKWLPVFTGFVVSSTVMIQTCQQVEI